MLGSGGEFFGLSLYETLADVEAVLAQTDPNQSPTRSITWISLVLEEATTLSFADLDAIERYGWPVAGEKAYPLVLKTIDGDDFSHPPAASDLAWLAAAIRTIPEFVSQNLRAEHGLPQPAKPVSLCLMFMAVGRYRYPILSARQRKPFPSRRPRNPSWKPSFRTGIGTKSRMSTPARWANFYFNFSISWMTAACPKKRFASMKIIVGSSGDFQ